MVTPVILTYNEDPNIESTLSSLNWAQRVVIVDSGSTDRTEEIARSFRNVAWFARSFDNHRAQWQYGVVGTSITTEYVLALDADMRTGIGFRQELQVFLDAAKFLGAWIPFEYRMLGTALPGSIYPAQIRIFRKSEVRIEQPGHTQVFAVDGPLYRFRSKLIHEDQKPISRWLNSQAKYAALEVTRIRSNNSPGIKDRLRLLGVSPAIWGMYAYLRAGGPFISKPARAYAYERLIFEAILARLLANESSPSHQENGDG